MNTSIEQDHHQQAWSFAQKLGFRFLFVYYALYFPSYLASTFPLGSFVSVFYDRLAKYLTVTLGKGLFGITETIKTAPTGSGDTLMHWTNLALVLLTCILVTVVWSALDRQRPHYRKLRQWLLLLLSYYVAFYMLSYGLSKVFYLQFSALRLTQLFETYGYSSPMRMLWTFMGSSKAYTMFGGWSEVIPGLLLLFRRTRVLGALATFAVMFNVFVMNMSFDIPVKLFSLHLTLAGLFIALVDYKRLLNLFILNQNTLPQTIHQPMFSTRRKQRILVIVQVIWVLYYVGLNISGNIYSLSRYGMSRPKPALYGIYNAEKFIKNGIEQPPLTTDTVRWQRLLVDYPKRVAVMHMNDALKYYRAKHDSTKQTITLSTRKDTVNKYVMKYERTGKDKKDLKLSGIFKKDTLEIHFKNYPLKNFLILNRGFNWRNDYPYQRHRVPTDKAPDKEKKK